MLQKNRGTHQGNPAFHNQMTNYGSVVFRPWLTPGLAFRVIQSAINMPIVAQLRSPIHQLYNYPEII
jgi:hypothetical protein